jgi:phosphonate transport system permease protein
MKKNLINYLKSIGTDLLYFVYILACIVFLIDFYTEDAFSKAICQQCKSTIWIILIPAIVFSLVLLLSKASLGYKIFLRKDDSPDKGGYWSYILPLILITFYTGWIVVEINPVEFFTQFKNSGNIFNGLFNPNFQKIMPLLNSLAETVFLAFMATIFAIPIAFVLSFFAARNLMSGNLVSKTVYFLIRTIATIFRSIEAVVWAIIFSVWVGIGPFAGMLALMTHSVASLVKLYSEQIENIDWGQVEAIKATGASTLQVWIYAVVPQILSPYLAFTIYRWDINVRMATIVGFVGGGGIGLALMQEQQMLAWRNVGLIMWLIAIVVWLMDMISARVREKLLES